MTLELTCSCEGSTYWRIETRYGSIYYVRLCAQHLSSSDEDRWEVTPLTDEEFTVEVVHEQ